MLILVQQGGCTECESYLQSCADGLSQRIKEVLKVYADPSDTSIQMVASSARQFLEARGYIRNNKITDFGKAIAERIS